MLNWTLRGAVGLALLCAVAAGAARAQAPCFPEQQGCLTVELFAVVNDPGNAMLAPVVSGQKKFHDDDLAQRVQVATKNNQGLHFYQGPLTGKVVVWKSSHRGVNRIRIDDNPDGGFRRERSAVSTMDARIPQVPSLGPPDYVFTMTAVGKIMTIAFPEDFFTPETHVMICAPGAPTLVPDASRQEAYWLTPSTIPYHLASRWVSEPFVVRASTNASLYR